MIKELIYFGLILLITSCKFGNKIQDSEKVQASLVREDDSIIKNKNLSSLESKVIASQPFDSIYATFTISPKSKGLFVKLDFNKKNELNKLYNKIGNSLLDLVLDNNMDTNDLKLIDSTGYHKLYSNPEITKMLSEYIGEEFWVYYIKGRKKSKIKDIVFHPDDCQTNYVILRLDSLETEMKDPIFASKKPLDLEYNNFKKINTQFNNEEDKIVKDYPDNKHINFFAKKDNYYLGYRDDFERYKSKEDGYYTNLKVYFPYRKIIQFSNDSIINLFHEEMDLFGVPCD